MRNCFLSLIALCLLAACGVRSFKSGEILVVRDLTYEQVWNATYGTMKEAYYWTKDDTKAQGIIYAGSAACFFGGGDYIGIYITPTEPKSEKYEIKVVARRGTDEEDQRLEKRLRDEIAKKLSSVNGRIEIPSNAEAIKE